VTHNDSDIRFMRLAIEQAEEAAAEGEVPVGAVVVCDGEVVAYGKNRRETWQDPSAHAEMIAMRRAADEIGSWRLEGCTVYVTQEPCPMCAGALINARVERLVFGARNPKAGAVRSLHDLLDDGRFNHAVEVEESALAEECGDVLSDFFKAVREGTAPPKPSPDG
jgi:tRNA(adenine34) deaminase